MTMTANATAIQKALRDADTDPEQIRDLADQLAGETLTLNRLLGSALSATTAVRRVRQIVGAEQPIAESSRQINICLAGFVVFTLAGLLFRMYSTETLMPTALAVIATVFAAAAIALAARRFLRQRAQLRAALDSRTTRRR
jgi:hypothetical protein